VSIVQALAVTHVDVPDVEDLGEVFRSDAMTPAFNDILTEQSSVVARLLDDPEEEPGSAEDEDEGPDEESTKD
jgi:hypothetical protein